MEDQNRVLGDLEDPPPRRNDQEVAGNNGTHDMDHLGPLAKKIAEFDTPNQHFQSGSAVQPMRPHHEDFKISPQVIILVKEKQYHGFATEHTMDHIQLFEQVCDATNTNEESKNYLKCTLFSFSLGDKASKCLKSLPQASISTWEDCKAAFLNRFYTKSRSNLLRDKIQGFQEGAGESIFGAWERFQDYERDCPHHG
ncbi:hypothetical protein V5N11_004581 [Cardamine amara subsp. amara]|uniref:Retrotransposon gag domain-containing protein n=1 Tax=Cardamine amara subsp. amara TaxID=228776 RepID=A0ABD1BN44_CARAN